MSDLHPIVAEIEAFLSETKMSATRFGEEAVNDRNFVFQMRGGRSCLHPTERKVREFMEGYRAEQERAA